MNCISYSIFGLDNKAENCFDFKSYLRGLQLNIRMARLLYPDWAVHITVDCPSYEAIYGNYFNELENNLDIAVYLRVKERQALCVNMLYRLLPIFEKLSNKENKFDRVLCRDTDSLLCWKERQAVFYWEKQGTKAAHAMTDSVSHNIALMGGMVGFKSAEFKMLTEAKSFEELIIRAPHINYEVKGSDQTFLNDYVLPRVHTSITEHYFKGMPQSYRGDCHHSVNDLLHLPEYLRETDALGFHIGASGFQVDATVKFLRKHGSPADNEFFEALEKKFPDVFYWQL